MNRNDKADIIDNIIYGRLNGDSCIETAENYVDEVKSVDPILYAALKKMNDGTDEMIARLKTLSKEYKLEYNIDEI